MGFITGFILLHNILFYDSLLLNYWEYLTSARFKLRMNRLNFEISYSHPVKISSSSPPFVYCSDPGGPVPFLLLPSSLCGELACSLSCVGCDVSLFFLISFVNKLSLWIVILDNRVLSILLKPLQVTVFY